MDILLIFYSILFCLILVSPFILYKKISNSKKNNSSNEKIKKKFLLDNLRDLKAEMDTKKITYIEFENLSSSILSELQELDKRIKNDILICEKCNHKPQNSSAKYCEICGSKI